MMTEHIHMYTHLQDLLIITFSTEQVEVHMYINIVVIELTWTCTCMWRDMKLLVHVRHYVLYMILC